MIIKSLSRKKKSFKQLYNYINKEAEKQSIFTYNLQHNKDVINQFKENSDLLPGRKNGVYLYHEILSFHGDDKNISDEILLDLSSDWVKLRASNNLVYGAVHREKEHVHIHLMISSNPLLKKKNLRLSKKKFKDIKLELEEKQIKKYPHLQNSICQKSKSKENAKLKNYKNQSGKNKISKTDEIKNIIKKGISRPNFKEFLSSQNIEIYERGKNNGVIYKGRKYRFETLGFEKKLDKNISLKKESFPIDPMDQDIKTFQEIQERDQEEREKNINR